MDRRYLVILTTLLLCPNVNGQDLFQWLPLGGPRSSDVRDFAQAPNGNMYALVYSNAHNGSDHIYRSTDDGTTWELLDTSYDNPYYGIGVGPDNAVYVGSHFGIRRSTDEGSSWTDNTGAFGLNHQFIFGEGGIILAAGFFNGKYTNSAYSDDNGASWQVLPPPSTSGGYITALAIDDAGAIYAALYRTGIHKTTDMGVTWEIVNESEVQNTWHLYASDGGRLVALSDWSAVYSDDDGVSWSFPGEELGIVSTFAGSGESRLLAGRDRDSVSISEDIGRTWTTYFVSPIPGNQIHAISFDGLGNPYFATSAGLYRKNASTGAVELVYFQQGPPIVPSRIAGTRTNDILVSCMDYGLFVTPHMGNGWNYSQIVTPIFEPPLAFEQDNNGDLFAFTKYSVHRSSDNGTHWEQVSTLDSLAFTRNTAISIMGTLYAVVNYTTLGPERPGGIHYKTEQNPDWMKMAFHSDTVKDIAIDVLDRFYASDGYAIYRTTNMGGTWETMKNGDFSLIYVSDDNTVYITGYDGMHASTDGGASWTGIPFPYPAQAVAMVQDVLGRIFIALNGEVPNSNRGGVYVSLDGGASWTEENSGFEPFAATHKCFDMIIDNEGHLVVALESGVYRTSTPTSIEHPSNPVRFALSPAYPNPVSAGSEVVIPFQVEHTGGVTLSLYSTLGREVRRVNLGEITSPGGQIQLSTAGLIPGVYRYIVTAGGNRSAGNIVVR